MTGYALERRQSPSTGLLGMGILIVAEAMLFAAFIATYFYLRFESRVWPQGHVPEPRWAIPALLVAVLAATSAPMHFAWRAVQSGRLAAARLLLVGALTVQAGYFAYEAHDFAAQLHGVSMTQNAYTSIYYILLGADHAHVCVGLLFDVWLLAKLARGITRYRVTAAQAIAWYWHFVNVLTIVVLATLLSARV